MQLGDAIYAILTSDPGVSAIVGTNVYPDIAEQEQTAPYITYEIIDHISYGTQDGPSLIDQVIVSFACVHTGYRDTVALSHALREALDHITPGTHGGVTIGTCAFETTSPAFENEDNRWVTDTVYKFNLPTSFA